MKKILILVVLLVLNIFTIKITFAVMAAPSSTCEINADVVKIEKDNDYYYVALNISKISTYQNEGTPCGASYINSVNDYHGALLYSDEYNKTPIFEGQKIQSLIHFGGDERFRGYSLFNIKILEDSLDQHKEINKYNSGKDVQKNNINYWYYIVPIGLGLLIGILFKILKRRNNLN